MGRPGKAVKRMASGAIASALGLVLAPAAMADAPRGAGAVLWERQADPAQDPLHGIAVEHVAQDDETASLEREIASLGDNGDMAVGEPGPLDVVLRTMDRLPEPATWGLMILGFGAIGGAMRHRIRKSDAAFTARIRRIAEGDDGAD